MDFSTFDKVTKNRWIDKITVDLKGKPIETLDWVINEKLVVSPFKDESDLKFSTSIKTDKNNNGWLAMEPIQVSEDLPLANGVILSALQGGANAIRLHTNRLLASSDLELLFRDVYLDMIGLDWVMGSDVDASNQIAAIASYIDTKGKSLTDIKLSIDSAPNSIDKAFVRAHPTIRSITIDGLAYYEGISGVHQELGNIIYKLYKSIEHIDHDDLSKVYDAIQIKLAIDDCYFLNIAAARAIRHLVRLLFGAYGYRPDHDIYLSCILSETVITDDVNYNRIKQSTAALSAVAASADTIQIYRDYNSVKDTKIFSRRIARNTFHLLSMESYMDRVVDPAAGSYYIESLTDTVAAMSWGYFQELWAKQNQP